MSLKSTYDKMAEDWFKDHNNDTWWQDGTNKFLSFLPKGATILDVGCGGGFKTKYIADKGFKVLGTDFSEKMVEISKREFPSCEFDVLDIYNIDTYPGNFDAIFAQAVILHVPKNRVIEVLQKMKNKLNNGGFLYIGVKSVREDNIDEKVTVENDYGYEVERFFSFFTQEELRNYFTKLDLEVIWEDSTSSGKATWLQIVGKKK